MPLTTQQRARYRRNIDVPGVGEVGQERLLASRVIVVGAGGLGSAALPYLVAAGIGRVMIVDGDIVEEQNLQRQVLHRQIGAPKAQSAAQVLSGLNPDVEITPIDEFLTPRLAKRLFSDTDLVLDCTDQFSAKYLISDAACAAGTPLVWASAVGMQGQCSVFGVPDQYGDCLWLRDLYPVEPEPGTYPTAEHIGILGATVAQVGTLQAGEAIKLLSGVGRLLVGRLWMLDAANGCYDVIDVRKRVVP